MAASQWPESWARTVSTPEFEFPTRRLSAAYLFGMLEVVLPGQIAFEKEYEQLNPTKNVLNLGKIESRNNWRLVKSFDTVKLHGAIYAQAKVFKGAEKSRLRGVSCGKLLKSLWTTFGSQDFF